MTISTESAITVPRKKKDVDERSPLLPKTEEDVGEGGFNGASFSGAVFNLSTTVVGAGIMALPATIKVLGIVMGVAMIAFLGVLTDASIDILLRFSKASGTFSYGGVMGDAHGKLGRMVLQISVIINNLGMLVVYMIIIGDVLSGTSTSGVHHAGILEGWFGPSWWNGRTVVLLLTTLLVLAPLVSFKRVDSLRFTSALSVALAVAFVVITAGIAIVKMFMGSIHWPRLLPDISDATSILKLFTVVPVIVTAYICHYNVHSIYNELEKQSEMKAIVRTSLGLCSSVYIATSFFGYLLFGEQTMDDVLSNFDTNLGVPGSEILNDTVRITYAAHLMLVFPLIFFALRLNVDGLIFPSRRALVLDNCRFIFSTAGLLAIVFLGATFIPSIWDAFQFTGATAAVCIGFIFPATIALKDSPKISTRKDKYLSWLMIILAVMSSIVAISSDIYDAFNQSEEQATHS
eukprot:TRINITY_DN3904_c0_g1_i1.p1 TRINITY_DN3904_c0_g1~~TRINITY_DN3904_c0_g1_i1.p1  ORF type:complete len:461 (+),score=57.39 TRINITY_DN3904_c0_g1_i1:379-1761(+)